MSRSASTRIASPAPDQSSIDAYGQGRHYGKQWAHNGASGGEIDNLSEAWSKVEPGAEDAILGTTGDDAFGGPHRVYLMISGEDPDDVRREDVQAFLDAYAAHVDDEIMADPEFWRGFIRGALDLAD